MARGSRPKPMEEKRWSGELTIGRVAELRTELVQALMASDRLSLDLSAVTEIDAACLQLLCAGHRTASRLKKQLVLTGTGRLMPVLRDAGFVRHTGCTLDCRQSCIWVVPRPSGKEHE